MTSEKDAPAEMPGEEEIARAIYGAACESYTATPRWSDEHTEVKALYRAQARAVLALFAPILAEKERNTSEAKVSN